MNRRTFVWLCLVTLSCACHTLSSNEQKVVGTWEGYSIDAKWRMTLSADHTLVLALEDYETGLYSPLGFGNWRLERTTLVLESFLPYVDPITGKPREQSKEIRRMPILEFQQDKLIMEHEFSYVRVK